MRQNQSFSVRLKNNNEPVCVSSSGAAGDQHGKVLHSTLHITLDTVSSSLFSLTLCFSSTSTHNKTLKVESWYQILIQKLDFSLEFDTQVVSWRIIIHIYWGVCWSKCFYNTMNSMVTVVQTRFYEENNMHHTLTLIFYTFSWNLTFLGQ